MNETVTGNDRWTGIYCLAVPHGGRDAATPCSVPMGLLCSMLPLVEFGMVSCYRLRRALGPSLLLIEPTSPVAGASSSRRSCCLPNLLLAASGCTISAVAASFDSSMFSSFLSTTCALESLRLLLLCSFGQAKRNEEWIQEAWRVGVSQGTTQESAHLLSKFVLALLVPTTSPANSLIEYFISAMYFIL
ncbi:hypothetical protein ACQJBY_036366 [Aegilops geniculata]